MDQASCRQEGSASARLGIRTSWRRWWGGEADGVPARAVDGGGAAGTSVGAVSGMLLIARWRVVVGILFTGAVVLGYLAPLWL